jgi:cytosine/adenosine deaminase-related metal-dependent hydrolase
MAAKSILLQGGTLLIHDEDDHVESIKADLLIEGNVIAKAEADIKPSAGTQIIDCTDKIISPGFIDTHHHVWQTLQKGRHANELLLDYMPSGTNSPLQESVRSDILRQLHKLSSHTCRHLLG